MNSIWEAKFSPPVRNRTFERVHLGMNWMSQCTTVAYSKKRGLPHSNHTVTTHSSPTHYYMRWGCQMLKQCSWRPAMAVSWQNEEWGKKWQQRNHSHKLVTKASRKEELDDRMNSSTIAKYKTTCMVTEKVPSIMKMKTRIFPHLHQTFQQQAEKINPVKD